MAANHFRWASTVIFLVIGATLSGCTHNIQLSPPLSSLYSFEPANSSNRSVAYYIRNQDRQQIVTMPAHGGDKVSYSPYSDTEAALNIVLNKLYNQVYQLDSLHDRSYLEFVKEKDITLVFIPHIVTTSSSSKWGHWPPTEFTFSLTITVLDPEGQGVWEETFFGEGEATPREWRRDKAGFSLAAQRAAQSAFEKMMRKIYTESLLN